MGVAALLASAVVVVVGDRAADGEPVVEYNAVVNHGGPEALVDARNSPTIVRNPTDPDNVAVTHRVDRPNFAAELHWSDDGGRTWTETDLPLPDGLDRAFAPDAAFAPDGTLYVSYVNLEGSGNVPANLWLVRSDDGGRTLSEPVRVSGELTFQTRVVVDGEGVVHLVFVQGQNVAPLQFVGPVEIVAVRSDDGGETFSDPVAVSDPDRPRVGAPAPAVDRNGDLVVVYQDFTTNVRDFQNLEGPPWPEPAALIFTRSADSGRSFAPGREVDTDLQPAKRFLPFLPEFPSLAVGPDGDLAVAWSDARHGDEDVFLRRSTDGGATWTEPVRVNDNPVEDGTAQYMPAVAVASDGRIDVAFLDRRDDADNHRMHTTLASSTDHAASFRNMRISTEPSDSRIGATASPHLEIDFGTRIDLTTDRSSALVAWTDTRLAAHPDHGRQDIFAARVSMPASPAWMGPLLVALALTGLGCLAAAAWLRLRRRRAVRPTASG